MLYPELSTGSSFLNVVKGNIYLYDISENFLERAHVI